METYAQTNTRHQKEVNDLPIGFAFSQQQFDEMLIKLGSDGSDLISIGSGGYIKQCDMDKVDSVFERHHKENEQLLKIDKYLIDAIRYELGNHEFIITYDPTPAPTAVGVVLDDDRTIKCFKEAKRLYLKWYQEHPENC